MIQWSDEYLTGDLFIDAEHRILVKLTQKIIRKKGTLEKNEFQRYVRILFNYARFHFQHEEQVLEDLGLEDLEGHKRKHQSIIEEMKKLLSENKEIEALQIKFSMLLNKWIMDHIIQEDMKYKSLLNQKQGFLKLGDFD